MDNNMTANEAAAVLVSTYAGHARAQAALVVRHARAKTEAARIMLRTLFHAIENSRG